MKLLQRVAFIGNFLPRRCGIATFTHDLYRAVSTARPDLETCVVAMTDPGCTYDYPPAVRFEIHDDTISDYVAAAEFLNSAGFDLVCLQHVGLLALTAAREAGAGKIVSTDTLAAKRELALALGADAVVDARRPTWPGRSGASWEKAWTSSSTAWPTSPPWLRRSRWPSREARW